MNSLSIKIYLELNMPGDNDTVGDKDRIINALSDKAREIQFLLGTASSAVGEAFDKVDGTLSATKQQIDNIVNKVATYVYMTFLIHSSIISNFDIGLAYIANGSIVVLLLHYLLF